MKIGKITQLLVLNSVEQIFFGNHRLGKLPDSDWLRDSEFIRNLRGNYRSQGQHL